MNLDDDPELEVVISDVIDTNSQQSSGNLVQKYRILDNIPDTAALPGVPSFPLVASLTVYDWLYHSPNNIVPVDINGDGKKLLFFPKKTVPYSKWDLIDPILGQTLTQPEGNVVYGAGGKVQYAIGDVNGDGADDVVALYLGFHSSSRNQVKVFLSTGNGYVSGEIWNLPFAIPNYGEQYDTATLSIKDTNADGLGDIVIEHWNSYYEESKCYGYNPSFSTHFPKRNTYVFLSTGSGIAQQDPAGQTYTATTSLITGANNLTGDFDGDGLLDFVGLGGNEDQDADGSPDWGRIVFGNGKIPYLLTKVTGQTGGITSVNYAPTSDYNTPETPSVGQVVAQITSEDGRGNSRTVEYSYEGGKFDYHLRRSLGFAKVTATLPAVNDTFLPGNTANPFIETNYSQSRASVGRITSQTLSGPRVLDPRLSDVSTYGDVVIYAQVNNQYLETGSLNSLPFRAVKTQTERGERYSEALLMRTEQYELNVCGEPTVVKSLGYLAGYDDVTTQFWYKVNVGKYIVNRPWRKITMQGDTPLPSWSTNNRINWIGVDFFNYDGNSQFVAPSNGNLTKHWIWDGENGSGVGKLVETTFTVDGYGNVESETDAGGHTTQFEYDASRKLFLTKTTNAKGHTNETSWFSSCQAPNMRTNVNGIVTKFSYDVYCREVKKEFPYVNGEVSPTYTTEYKKIGTPLTQHILRTSPAPSLTSGDKLTFVEYFDGFGQTYLTASSISTDSNPAMIAQVSAFDGHGNIKWQSLPQAWTLPSNLDANPINPSGIGDGAIVKSGV